MNCGSYWKHKVLRTVLLGTVDSRSTLFILRGNDFVLQTIFDMVIELWISHINSEAKGYAKRDHLKFPPPQGIQINMMPFMMGARGSLPMKYWCYWPMISRCNVEELGKTCYLTIHESTASNGTLQQQRGIHTEIPGRFHMADTLYNEATIMSELFRIRYPGEGWRLDDKCTGGIYMASNVTGSYELWDKIIERPEHVIGIDGDIEHLRDFLGEGHLMERDRIYWITDRTPHEFQPMRKTQRRQYYRSVKKTQTMQYFRLVTCKISGWFEKYSTPNPLGHLPDCEIIKNDFCGTNSLLG